MILGKMPTTYSVYVTEGKGYYPVDGQLVDCFIFDMDEAIATAARHAETVEPGDEPTMVRVAYDHADLGWIVCYNRQVG
jgi:hypothetical protein